MDDTLPGGCPACDCADSPLSIVGNVVGILTFVLGVFAYVAAFIAVTRGAANDMRDTEDVLKATQGQIKQITDILKVLYNRSDPALQDMKSLVDDSLQSLVKAKDDLNEFLLRFKVARDGREDMVADESLWSQFKWWYYERDKEARIAKLRGSQQHFAAVQLTFLER
jgi:hypothetical protein